MSKTLRFILLKEITVVLFVLLTSLFLGYFFCVSPKLKLYFAAIVLLSIVTFHPLLSLRNKGRKTTSYGCDIIRGLLLSLGACSLGGGAALFVLLSNSVNLFRLWPVYMICVISYLVSTILYASMDTALAQSISSTPKPQVSDVISGENLESEQVDDQESD